MKNWLKPLAIICITGLGIIVYSNSFICPFHFDDDVFIVNNFAIRDLSNLRNIWNCGPCRFITFFSFAYNYHFYQLNVFGYHLFNLGVHLLSSICVWWLVLLTFRTPVMKDKDITRHANLIAFLSGLIFVSHPIQTQAVTFIWQRAASMAALFYLVSLCCYVKSRLYFMDSRFRGNDKNDDVIPAKAGIQIRINSALLGKIYYSCSLIAAIMAMFTKENAITLPLMIVFYEISFLKINNNFKWKRLIPFIFIFMIIPLAWIFSGAEKDLASHSIITYISPIQYLLTEFRVILTYIRLIFIPIHQNLDYDYSLSKSILEAPTLFSLLFLGVILFFSKKMFLKYRLVSFAIFWFFLTLLPESSFFPFADAIEEHRLYLPMVGYSIFLASGMYYLLGKNNIKSMVMVLMMMVVFYSVLTYQRNKVWEDDITLWDDTIAKSPQKSRPYDNRGLDYFNQGKLDLAMADFNKAILLDPNNVEAYCNRGAIYEKKGDLTRALIEYSKAIYVNPVFWLGYHDRIFIYKKRGDFNQALSDATKVIELNPNDPEPYTIRGVIYCDHGDFIRAISDFNKSIQIDPNYAPAYMNLGVTYGKKGNLTQALLYLNKAIEIDPDNRVADNNRVVLYSMFKNHNMSIPKN